MAPRRAPTKNTGKKRNNTASVRRQIQQLLLDRQERKVASTQAAGVTISSSGTMISLTTGIAEGNEINTRTGTTLRVLSQTFRMTFRAITNDQSARFIIFRDMFNTGTTPTVTEVLPTTGILSHFSDVREIQQRRYQILLDRIIDCSTAGPSIKTQVAKIVKQGMVYYNGPTAVATANGRGAIFLLVIGSLSTGTFDYDWQGVFTDS